MIGCTAHIRRKDALMTDTATLPVEGPTRHSRCGIASISLAFVLWSVLAVILVFIFRYLFEIDDYNFAQFLDSHSILFPYLHSHC